MGEILNCAELNLSTEDIYAFFFHLIGIHKLYVFVCVQRNQKMNINNMNL